VDNGYSRLTEVEAWGTATAPAKTNVASRTSGAVATASSEIAAGCDTWPARGANDGDRKGAYWGGTGGWADASAGNFSNDWLQIDFNGNQTIDEIDVFTLQDNYANPVEPTETTTFSSYGLTAFDASYWNGSSWVQIPETVVTGNNKVWRKFTFSAITTSKFRVYGLAAIDNGFSRIAEVEAWSPTESSAGVGIQWLVSDQLGTPRMIVDETGALANMKRHDYLPFGEELIPPTGGRTPAMGYASDDIRQQFTAKERDVETNLDFFGARYFASIQGRFTSPDPLHASARPSVPQSWNRYSYVLNNPLKLVDPTGLADDDPQKKKDEQPQQPPPTQAIVVDLRKDKTINAELDKIRATAKPLPANAKPELTDVKTIVGDTSNINNGGYIDGYGNEATGFTGTVRGVAYVPLDQGGNIIEGNGVAIGEAVEVKQGDPPKTTQGLAPTPPGGVFIDVQSANAGSQTTVLKQRVFVGQFPPDPKAPAKHVFTVGVNEITKDPRAGTISIKIGLTTKLR
jgi:RHS repeat-associated protein